MISKPLVSIIMPAYNAEKTIAESVQSVLNQTYTNWELIIVNDGSTDNTSGVVKSFVDHRIKLIEQLNEGVSSARNNGITQSEGDYIAFLDSDDLWLGNKLEIQIEYFKNNEHLGLVYTDRRCFYNEDIANMFDCVPKELVELNDDYLRLLTYNYIATLTVMVKKDALNKVGLFDTELLVAEDWDLWIRIAKEYNIEHIASKLAYYREHSSGISKNIERIFRDKWKVIEKHVVNCSDIPKIAIDSTLWVWNKNNFVYHMSKKNYIKALRYYFKCLKYLPILSMKFIMLAIKKRICKKLQIFCS